MACVTVHCPCCQSAQVYRHGQNPKGHDRFRCRVFQLTCTYQARKPGVKEQITEMAFNGAGSRYRQNTESRYQHCNPDFKKLPPRRVTSSPAGHADVTLICEPDEQWSFIGSKARKHWLWYAYNTKTGGVLACTFGSRTDNLS